AAALEQPGEVVEVAARMRLRHPPAPRVFRVPVYQRVDLDHESLLRKQPEQLHAVQEGVRTAHAEEPDQCVPVRIRVAEAYAGRLQTYRLLRQQVDAPAGGAKRGG